MPIDFLYIGFSSIKLISQGGVNVVIDPWLTENPDCRVRLEELGDVDVLLVSHGARDHFGDTLEVMRRSDAKLYCGREVAFYCTRNGIPSSRIRSLVYGATFRHGDVEVRAVEARHCSFMEVDGQLLSGQPLGFVVGFDSGEKLYFPGDTAIFSDLKLIGDLHQPNIALFGVGSVRGGPTEMNPEEAVLAAKWIGARIVMPIHYLPETPNRQAFVDGVRATGLPFEVLDMNSGDRRTVTAMGRI